MTSFQLMILAIILYSVATTFFIIFQAWQLYRTRKENDELCFEIRMFKKCLENNLIDVSERNKTDTMFLPN